MMNINTLNRLCTLVFLMVLLPGLAQAERLGSRAGAFLRMGLGADRVAMGETGVALNHSGMNWFYNPAAIAFQPYHQVSLSYRVLSLDRSLAYTGFSMPVKPKSGVNAGLAIGVLRASVDNLDARDSNGEQFDIPSWSNNLIHGTFSLMPHPRFSVGISIKWYINSVPKVLDDDKTLSTLDIGLDLGARVSVAPGIVIGLQLRDLTGKNVWETNEVWGDDKAVKEDRLPTQIRLGGAFSRIDNLILTADMVMYVQAVGDDDDAIQPHLGVEWSQRYSKSGTYILRGGFNGRAPAVGFGLKLRRSFGTARLDYAFALPTEEPDGSHLFGWVFEW